MYWKVYAVVTIITGFYLPIQQPGGQKKKLVRNGKPP